MVASHWVKIGLISYFPSPAWPVTRSHRSTRRFLGLNICSANALLSWVRDSLYIFSTACACCVDRGRVSSCFDAFSVTSEQPSLNIHLPSLKIGILSFGIFFFFFNKLWQPHLCRSIHSCRGVLQPTLPFSFLRCIIMDLQFGHRKA